MKYNLVSCRIDTVEEGKRNAGTKYIRATFQRAGYDPKFGNLEQAKNLTFYPVDKAGEAAFLAAWAGDLVSPQTSIEASTFDVEVGPHYKLYMRNDDQGHKKGQVMRDETKHPIEFTKISIFSIVDVETGEPLIKIDAAAKRIMKSSCLTVEQFKERQEAQRKAKEAADALAAGNSQFGNPGIDDEP